MSEADNYPDYDFSFLDGTVGSDLAVVGKGLDAAAADVQSHTRELSDTADGATVTQVHEDLVEIRDALSAAATNAAQTAEAFEVMKAAWAAWQAIAPRQAEIVAAEAAVARAREMLKASDNHHAGLARGALKRAQDTLRDLIQRREDADAALVEALEKARNMLALAATVDVSGERVGRRTPSPTTPAPDVPKSTEPGAPSTPSAAAPSPAAAAPAPSAELPAPGTSLSAAGDASTPALSPTAAAALGAAAAQPQQAQQPQQAAAGQMPQMPALPPQQQPQQRPKDPYTAGLDAAPLNLGAILGGALFPAAPAAAAGLPGGLSAPSPANPVATPGVGGLAGAAPANAVAAPAPATTGTSVTGLHTDNNVSGRPDGVAPRTAFTPNPAAGTATHLAGSGGAGAGTEAGAQPRAAAGHGGMMPMMPPMMGGAGGAGAARSDRDPVHSYDPDQQELHGIGVVADAVPGGTIAQRRRDD